MNPKEYLSHLIANVQVPHALLVIGKDGPEKERLIFEFALNLVGNGKLATQHPDIHIYQPEGKTGMHPISHLREMIESSFLAPYQSNCKVFIWMQAERMLPTSSNAFLKTLEEPPSQTYFILSSQHPEKMLPTLLSRCQIVEFPSPKSTPHHPILEVLLGKTPLEEIEITDYDALIEVLYHWFRDRFLLELKGTCLTFPEHVAAIQKAPLLDLEDLERELVRTRHALECSIKPHTCLHSLFFTLFH